MYYEKFDENGRGLGCSNTRPDDMGGVFEIVDELAGKRLRLDNGKVREETIGEFEEIMNTLKENSELK